MYSIRYTAIASMPTEYAVHDHHCTSTVGTRLRYGRIRDQVECSLLTQRRTTRNTQHAHAVLHA